LFLPPYFFFSRAFKRPITFFTHDIVYQQHEKYILRDKGLKDKTRIIFEIYLKCFIDFLLDIRTSVIENFTGRGSSDRCQFRPLYLQFNFQHLLKIFLVLQWHVF
jgi:hypothetical protein